MGLIDRGGRDDPLPDRIGQLWETDRVTQAEKVVLIVPEAVEQGHPGQPRGYRIVRRYVDDRIGAPERLPLTVIELQRTSAS